MDEKLSIRAAEETASPTYDELLLLKGRVEAAVSYYNAVDFPDANVIIAILGRESKRK